MFIDAHQHFWKYNPLEYGWINDEMAILKQNFLPEQLSQELKSLEIDGSVVVQARQTLEETEWLLTLANEYEFIKGVVGWVDICSDEIEMQLNKLSKNKKDPSVHSQRVLLCMKC